MRLDTLTTHGQSLPRLEPGTYAWSAGPADSDGTLVRPEDRSRDLDLGAGETVEPEHDVETLSGAAGSRPGPR